MNFFDAFKKALIGNEPVVDTSPKLKTNETDWAKIAIHALVVGGVSAITVLAQYVSNTHWGEYNAIVIPVASTISTYLIKLIKSNDPIVPTETK